MPEGMAWDTPPMAEAGAGTVDREKKSRSWRKGRSAAATAATAATAGSLPAPPDTAATSAFAPVEPPTRAPVDPVPLSTDKPLPPPPSEEVAAASGSSRPMLWKPPIDPATGEPAWDQSPAAPAKPAKKQRSWRKGTKAGAVAAGAAGAATAATAATVAGEATAAGAEGLGAPPAPPSAGAPSNGTPPTVAAPPSAPPTAAGSTPPPAGSPPPTATDHDLDAGAPAKSNRSLLAVLLVVLVVVIGGIAYFAVKKSNTTTPTTVATGTTPPTAGSSAGSSSAAATALATSLNLRLTDLPSGWTRSPAPPAASPTGPLADAQNVAERTLSTCLGQPFGVVAGLFGDAPLPAAAGSAASPTFQDGTVPGVQMASTSSIQTTVTQNQVLTGPFANPKFITCYAVYQTALASASAQGSVATVQTVTLPVPAGVTCWAFLTTITNPARGTTKVEGEAYIFGGRDLTRLSPLTNGPPVPQGPFSMAYDAITARVAKALHR